MSPRTQSPGVPNRREPLVVAVILNWNSRSDTLSCLESLAGQSYPRLRTVVIDNGSFDGTLDEATARFPDTATMQLRTNTGYTGGNNEGIRRALAQEADYVFVVNSDVILDPSTISELVRAAGPGVAAAGPTVFHLPERDRVQSAGCLFDRWRGMARILTTPSNEARDVDYVAGSAMLLSRAALKHIGLLDDRFFAYAEEVDWCLRAKGAGYRVVHVPRARIWHRWVGVAPTPFVQFLTSRNALRVAVRHCHGIKRLSALAYLCLVWTPKRSLSAAKSGDMASALATLQGALWHLGLFRRRNPLALVGVREGQGSP